MAFGLSDGIGIPATIGVTITGGLRDVPSDLCSGAGFSGFDSCFGFGSGFGSAFGCGLDGAFAASAFFLASSAATLACFCFF